eukprot:CAMPEP_0206282538 /NCGR_PEP_ID=MMETSP0047_2-20121206/39741_1 /ASSEMBLY_ACC=CAM_ASM_000192 /TAXON_ID=195065 /ORGANISM="Chroomonas mesostigmatica_cf, Strain CCMP1168" /LENGTH=288 /DNA_ID=CAMNT_0053712825 /DNA_START=1 /DNA_END=864 /DNA_ORIENTATION=+
MLLALIPGITMAIGGLYPVLANRLPGKQVTYALQHLAAGILLCAIAQELVPTLTAATTVNELASILVGFTLGVIIMVGLKEALGQAEEVDEPEEGEGVSLLDAEAAAAQGNNAQSPPAHSRRSTDDLMRRTPSIKEAGSARKKQSYVWVSQQKSEPFPWTFATCVYIDSAMDGLLIGLTLVTGQSAGLFMAIALCVEMGFLGLTFQAPAGASPSGRGLIANALAVNHAALVGCTSFGTAALLYMVCEELLVAAHESGDEHVWWVDLQVYLGFMFSLILQKAFELSALP